MTTIDTSRNPFLKTQKHDPDGRCTASRSVIKRQLWEYTETGTAQDRYILIYPGVNANMKYIGNFTEGLNTAPIYLNNWDTVVFDDEPRGHNGQVVQQNDYMFWWRPTIKNNIRSWRCKGSAVKINLQPATDDLDGTFEACAIQMPSNPQYYKWVELENQSATGWGFLGDLSSASPMGGLTPRNPANLRTAWLEQIKFEDHASFKSGTLSELNGTIWTCPLHNTLNNFIDISREQICTEYPDNTQQQGLWERQLRWGLRGEIDAPIFDKWWHNTIKSCFDTNYLMWVIRIKAQDKINPSIESRAHLELIYEDDTDDVQFMDYHLPQQAGEQNLAKTTAPTAAKETKDMEGKHDRESHVEARNKRIKTLKDHGLEEGHELKNIWETEDEEDKGYYEKIIDEVHDKELQRIENQDEGLDSKGDIEAREFFDAAQEIQDLLETGYENFEDWNTRRRQPAPKRPQEDAEENQKGKKPKVITPSPKPRRRKRDDEHKPNKKPRGKKKDDEDHTGDV